jgi:Electron transfer DM13
MSITHAIPLNWRFSLVVLGFIAAVPLGWYLGSPLFVNRAVSEALPSSQASGNTTTGPHVMAQGAFGIVDAIHHGEGTASLLNLSDGTRILRLGQDFRVTNGPDLYVYLSANPAPRTSSQLRDAGAFEVAPLKGNIGDQNYALPVISTWITSHRWSSIVDGSMWSSAARS